MTLRKGITALALIAGLSIGVTSQATAQVSVNPGVTGVTIGGSNGTGLYIPYGGGGVTFSSPSLGAWNYSNGTISPAYGSYYTPYGNNWYGSNMYSNGWYGNNWTGAYSGYSMPYSNWTNGYSSFYTPYYSNWGSYSYPYSYGTTYYGNSGRRGIFRR